MLPVDSTLEQTGLITLSISFPLPLALYSNQPGHIEQNLIFSLVIELDFRSVAFVGLSLRRKLRRGRLAESYGRRMSMVVYPSEKQ